MDSDVVADVARRLVAETAPQELPLFPSLSRAYLADPQKALEQQEGKDEVLGFGAAAVVMFVTPVAFEVVKSVISFLAGQVKDAVEHETSDAIAARVHALFHRDDPGAAPLTLTREQLLRVRELALEKARQLNLPEPQADLLADSMVGSLVTS